MSVEETELRRRLLMLFKNHAEMVDTYIAQYGTDVNMKNIQAVRSQFPKLGDTGSQPTVTEEENSIGTSESVETAAQAAENPMDFIFKFNNKALESPKYDPTLDSPLFPRVVDCPICQKWGVNALELRAKSLSQLNDPFMAPVYLSSAGKFQAVNYLLASVTVCESCLLASPDRKDFNLYNRTTRQNQGTQLPPAAQREIKETIDKRKAFFEKTGVGDILFQLPRSPAAAIVSYQLADIRAEIEVGAKVTGAYYKRGNYWTRIALLCRQCGMDDRKPLEIAAEHFQKAFSLSDFPKIDLEHQTLYILFNLYMYFGKPKEARDYLTVLDKTKQELEKNWETAPEGAFLSAKKWLEQGKYRWDDRDNPNFWKTPGIE